MKKENILKWVVLALAVAVNVFIIVNGFIEGAKSAEISGNFSQVVENIVNDISEGTVTDANRVQFRAFNRKLFGHFCLCGLSGILTTLSYHLFLKDYQIGFHVFGMVISSTFGFMIALFSELAQLVTKDRVFAMKDVAIDFVGYFLGILLIYLLLIIAKSPVFKFKKKQAE